MWGYIQQPVKAVTNWWYKDTQNIQNLTPVQRMEKFLKPCKYQSKHIHDQKILKEKLLMNFSQLKDAYPDSNFQTTIQKPFQVSSQQKQMSISIFGDVKIGDINGKYFLKLRLTIWFNPENFAQKGPTFFFRNPDGNKFRPTLKFRNIYEWVVGGVKIIEIPDKIQWQSYKNNSLKRAVKSIIQQAQQKIPFVKNKMFQKESGQSLEQINKQLQKKAKQLKTFYESISLQKIQSLYIINQILQSQNTFLISQKQKLNKIIQADQNSLYQINPLQLIHPSDQKSKIMLDLISQQRALNDCQQYLDSLFKKQQQQNSNIHKENKIDLQTFLSQIKTLSERKFQVRFLINKQMQIIQKSILKSYVDD